MISEEANLNLSFKSRMPALLCVLVVFLCGLATYPIAEIGMSDDFAHLADLGFGFIEIPWHRKLREIKPSDIDQRTGAPLCGDLERVGEGVTALAQPHQGKRRRQFDGFRYEGTRAHGR